MSDKKSVLVQDFVQRNSIVKIDDRSCCSISDERVELQDFAVQIVRGHLEKTGSKLMSWNTN